MLVLGDVEKLVLIHSGCGAFSLKLEYHDAIIMTSSKEVDLRVSSYNPKPIVLALKRLYRGPFVQIPDTNCFVLADREDEILMRVK